MKRSTILMVGLLTAVFAQSHRLDAHKPVTSKYSYTQDVQPIFRDKCGTCHRPGGVAPMSLLTYEEAFPWAESIRAELIAGHMPPAPADPTFGAIQHNAVLTAQETDVILTWATGGNPRGPEAPASPAAAHTDPEWPIGKPDLVLKLPETVTLAADKSEDVREFTVKPAVGAKWIRAVDVHPGSAAIVRNVTVSVKDATQPTSSTDDMIVCRWTPGRIPVDVSPAHAAFRLPEGGDLVVRVHYKKTYQYDGKAVSDDTAVGLYFAAAARPVQTISLEAPKPLATGSNTEYTIDVPRDVDALGVRVDQAPADELIQVTALPPDGTPIPLVRFTERPNWERRYWFNAPIAIAKGSRIQVRATYRDPALAADAFGGVNAVGAGAAATPLRVSLDVADRSH